MKFNVLNAIEFFFFLTMVFTTQEGKEGHVL